jgi:uncharacterized protein YndB with AHSA1/START domain
MASDISAFKPTVIYTIYIASTPHKVWEALTSPEFSKQYFSGLAVQIEPQVGGRFTLLAPDGSLHIGGEVVVWDPPRKLVTTFDVNWEGIREALGTETVTYELQPSGDTVRLKMTQRNERDLSDDILSGGREGWPAILSSLKSLLETGTVPAIEMKPPMRMIDALKKLGVKVPGM